MAGSWVALFLGEAASAQERIQVAKPPAGASYPRINLATGYEAVSDWPDSAAHHAWGAVAGIAVDASSNVWVFHRGKIPVEVYSAAGKPVRAWGEGDFREPHQIRIDRDGNIWLVDSGLHTVRKFTTDGRVLLTLGTPGAPGDDSTHFNRPTDVAITAAGEIFVADGYGNNRVVHFDERGEFVKAWGSLGAGRGMFSIPHSIAVDSLGRLYVADRNNARIQVFDQSGRFLDEWRELMVPWHIVITDNDEIYICGSSPMRWPRLPIPGLIVGIPPKDQLVMAFTADGRVKRLWAFPKGHHAGELDWVHGMAADRAGNLYLGDIQGKRVQKFLRLAPTATAGEIVGGQKPKGDAAVERSGKP
jgi:sugar lactone lactonase YvrE